MLTKSLLQRWRIGYYVVPSTLWFPKLYCTVSLQWNCRIFNDRAGIVGNGDVGGGDVDYGLKVDNGEGGGDGEAGLLHGPK